MVPPTACSISSFVLSFSTSMAMIFLLVALAMALLTSFTSAGDPVIFHHIFISHPYVASLVFGLQRAFTEYLLRGGRIVPVPQLQGHVHQGDQDRHLDQGADNRSESLLGGDAKDAHSNGDGQLEVVAGRSK